MYTKQREMNGDIQLAFVSVKYIQIASSNSIIPESGTPSPLQRFSELFRRSLYADPLDAGSVSDWNVAVRPR
jgi:hypothetical protein